VLFADELDVHLNPRIGRDWMLSGQQRLVLTPGQCQKAFVAGAYDPRTGRVICVDGDRKVSWLFLILLRALLESHRWARRIHLILDNYGIHKSQLVTALLRSIGTKIRLHFLPPYCPQENRIERLWKDVHDNVTWNHRHRTGLAGGRSSTNVPLRSAVVRPVRIPSPRSAGAAGAAAPSLRPSLILEEGLQLRF